MTDAKHIARSTSPARRRPRKSRPPVSETPDIVQNARDFIRQRDSHRESLRAELTTARERVREIEGLLAELGDTAVGTPQPPAPLKAW